MLSFILCYTSTSKWKYWNLPKIENRNGASEKTFSYTYTFTQNHFLNKCLCVPSKVGFRFLEEFSPLESRLLVHSVISYFTHEPFLEKAVPARRCPCQKNRD
ncbi:unnamed protein product [Nesidiocoris tenuis]|uniref:Uncharacterized protein n=1 Tax=Nesidiocoris tenuis TaxID=355587 RepID=A0A6H5HML8_9HEMI|nr:unnamed protein product [Nesidiocoris tenuis]